MDELRFSEDVDIKFKCVPKHVSSISLFLQKHSFGLIQTERQAELVQIIFVGALFLMTTYFLTHGTTMSIKQPSYDLIHSPQPTQPM